MIKTTLIIMAAAWIISLIAPLLNVMILKYKFEGWEELAITGARSYIDQRKNIIFYGIIIIASIYIIEHTNIDIVPKIAIGITTTLYIIDSIKNIIAFVAELIMIKKDETMKYEPSRTISTLIVNAILIFIIQTITNCGVIWVCSRILLLY